MLPCCATERRACPRDVEQEDALPLTLGTLARWKRPLAQLGQLQAEQAHRGGLGHMRP